MSADTRPLTAGVMGWPITHSKSPLIFEHWFRQTGIAGRYCHLAVQPDDFEAVYRALPKAGFRGVNVTIPHKEQALRLADRVTDAARRIGAANCIAFSPEGEIVADNTDAYGFLENIRLGAPGWEPSKAPACLLGAGGAARACAVALLDAGVPEVRLLNRTRSKADALAADIGGAITTHDWSARSEVLADIGLLANTTSLGMKGQPELELDLADLPAVAVVNDIVYAPLETPLLAGARARGNRVVDGLGMLLHQARPAFRTWFGADPVVDEDLRAICLK